MTLTFKDDLTTEALGRLAEQFKNKPKLTALISALMRQVQELEDSAQVLYFCRWVDNAEGTQLDGIGSIVNEQRAGRGDALYRLAIKAKVQINFSEAVPEDIYTAMRNFHARDYQLIPIYPAAFVLRLVDAWVEATEPSVEAFASLLNKVNGAGINAIFQYSEHDDVRTFAYTEADVLELDTKKGFAEPVWLAVPRNSDQIMRSTDAGDSWSAITAPYARNWYALAFGNDTWIVVGSTNYVLRSIDNGLTWSNSLAIATIAWNGVAYGNGVWIAVGSNGTDRVMRSIDDGATWSAVAVPETNDWRAVGYADGTWVAVASTGTNRAMYSIDDGLTWAAALIPDANYWGSLAYGDGVWISVSTAGTNRVARSEDGGATWVTVAAAAASTWISVTYGDGSWVAVAYSGTDRIMFSMDNGLTWSTSWLSSLEAGNGWRSVYYAFGTWVAVADSGTNRVIVSENGGRTWVPKTAGAVELWHAVGNGATGGFFSRIQEG